MSPDCSSTRRRSGSADDLPKGILDARSLPDESFEALWEAIVVGNDFKSLLTSQAVLNFTLRPKVDRADIPLHGVIILVGPPGTGKTSLARGLASRAANMLQVRNGVQYLEVEPHGLASSSLGRSQQAVQKLLGSVIAERAQNGPLVVVLDEVETLAADRQKMSMDANPVDVHRAADAVLAQLDQLAGTYPDLLFIATSNFPGAIDDAFLSRADLIVRVDLPTADACQAILTKTLEALGNVFPDVKKLPLDPKLKDVGQKCVGLDGRRIRKLVVSALALDKQTALNPARLTADQVLRAIELAQGEIKGKAK